MDIGLYGLGRMGGNMVTRLVRGGHRVVAGNRSPGPVDEAKTEGAVGAYSIEEMAKQLKPPRVLWSMVPSGEVTDHTLDEFARYAAGGDILVDGGNSYFRDSMRRAEKYKALGFDYLDIGVSGGVWGLENGYCMMVGGEARAVGIVKPVLDTLAPPNGWAHFGKSGAGHFIKMVHNGIEYGLMGAYAEGFNIIKNANIGRHPEGADAETTPLRHAEHYQFEVNISEVAEVWRRGSVIGSWLLDLIATALARDSELSSFGGQVSDSGEGRWTLQAAIDEGIPVPVISAALFARFSSRGNGEFADKLLSAMRYEFGGHLEKKV
jgi:6-phosphogluconate dehydrogenase